MAHNPLTVTNPNPTPPTNFVTVGATPPNPATYDVAQYNANGQPKLEQHPPQFDDGAAALEIYFAAAHAALPVGGTSVEHEGKGTETGYGATAVYMVGSGLPYTVTPNASHPSCLGVSTPAITSLSAGGASGVGYATLTVTGTGFDRSSVVKVSGAPQNTNYVSATSLTVTNAPKKRTAGSVPVTVTNGSNTTTAATNWTFT